MPVYHYHSNCFNKGKSQQGFTLIELLVAMTIFAVLAVAGWQVFASLNRTKEQAQVHRQTLSELQYAYLQLQRDFAQAVPWQQVIATDAPNNIQPSSAQQNNHQPHLKFDSSISAMPAFYLNADGVSFIRFADVDPRQQLTPALVKVSYHLHDGRLLRLQSYDIDGTIGKITNNNNPSQYGVMDNMLAIGSNDTTATVILGRHGNVNGLQWQAFVPQAVAEFGGNADDANLPDSNLAFNPLLPRGVGVRFNYMDEQLQWQFVVGDIIHKGQVGNVNVNQN